MTRTMSTETVTVSISVIPDPADVHQSTCAEATFTPPFTGEVTLIVKNAEGTVIRQRTVSADPYKVSFTPTTTGLWSVTVAWPGGSRTKNFQVQ